MSVKRLRWEQVENSEGTIWGQVSTTTRAVDGWMDGWMDGWKKIKDSWIVIKENVLNCLDNMIIKIHMPERRIDISW